MKPILLFSALALVGCAQRPQSLDTRDVQAALDRVNARQSSALIQSREVQKSSEQAGRHVHAASLDVDRIDGKSAVILRWLDAREKARHAP